MFDPKPFLQQLTSSPGVYRYYNNAGELLYVGKARNLKKRVSTYFLRASGDARIEAMVSQIRRVEVTLTHTEDEALLLESNLIKELSPRYNIVYRDDKSYPYVRLSAHGFPRISYYRGTKAAPHRYFGPFPSGAAVKETLTTIQRVFGLRPCRDTFFAHRTRACLQHQIRRCSGPCVGHVSKEEYARDVQYATRLLEGKGDALIGELGAEMEQAAEELMFERAASIRDQIGALKRVRESKNLTGGAEDLDVVAVALHPSSACVVVMSVRDGMNLGHRSHFPKHPPHAAAEELLESFLSQHYQGQPPPPEILTSHAVDDEAMLPEALGIRAGRKVTVCVPQRGSKVRLLDMAKNTAAQALSQRLVEAASMDDRLRELMQVLDLDKPPQRMECFDISHTMGERAVASCVVFNGEGPLKTAYRKFNIETAEELAAGRSTGGKKGAKRRKDAAAAAEAQAIEAGVAGIVPTVDAASPADASPSPSSKTATGEAIPGSAAAVDLDHDALDNDPTLDADGISVIEDGIEAGAMASNGDALTRVDAGSDPSTVASNTIDGTSFAVDGVAEEALPDTAAATTAAKAPTVGTGSPGETLESAPPAPSLRQAITGGDDYAAIHQAVKRRYARIKAGEVQMPDLLFIDGGQGQLSAAMDALEELELADQVRVVAIAKGPTRKPGLEELLLPEQRLPIRLPPDSPALHLIQRIRDEAHRFAITGHRAAREKARTTSTLEDIEGLGPGRRRSLLTAFGGLKRVQNASVDELAKVDGINRALAERIYAHYH